MPVNNWIPVAQQFGQFLNQQSERKRKLMQRNMMQILPGYVAGELSSAKTQEDIYKKLPELSAQMFAIDPEVGAAATQIANQYGQMKLNQIQQVEKERIAQEGLEVFKQNFGSVPVTQNGKVVMFKDVIDNMSKRGMRNEDILNYGEVVLKQAAVKQQRVFNYAKGKSILTEWQMDNAGRIVGEGKKYQIDNTTKRMDDLSTQGFDNLELLPEAAAGYAEIEELRRRTDEQLKKQKEYLAYSHELTKDDDLRERKATMLIMKDKDEPEMGYIGKRYIEQPDPDNPQKTIKVKVDRYFDVDGNDITNKVDVNKVFAGMFTEDDWKDARTAANDEAEAFLTKWVDPADVFKDKSANNSRLEEAFGEAKYNGFDENLRDRKQFGYATEVLDRLNKTTHQDYRRFAPQEDALVMEIAARLGIWDPINGVLNKKYYDELWTDWKMYKKYNKIRSEKSGLKFKNTENPSGNSTVTKKKNIGD